MSQMELINLPRIYDARGNLTFIEYEKHIHFEIKRVFYLYDIPAGETRAGHALRECQQFIISLSGSFDVIVDNGKEKLMYTLNRPWIGLYLPPLLWRELENFSTGSVCLVLASDLYNENSYIRDYEEFIQIVNKGIS